MCSIDMRRAAHTALVSAMGSAEARQALLQRPNVPGPDAAAAADDLGAAVDPGARFLQILFRRHLIDEGPLRPEPLGGVRVTADWLIRRQLD